MRRSLQTQQCCINLMVSMGGHLAFDLSENHDSLILNLLS